MVNILFCDYIEQLNGTTAIYSNASCSSFQIVLLPHLFNKGKRFVVKLSRIDIEH